MKLSVKVVVENDSLLPEQYGNWIDLKSNKRIQQRSINTPQEREPFIFSISQVLIPLGIKMTLPKWYRAELKPRSSSFRKFGFIQTNGVGEIEWDYADEWMLPVIFLKEGEIKSGERICQFQISLRPDAPWYIKLRDLFVNGFKFVKVDKLETNRKGFGSTGQ